MVNVGDVKWVYVNDWRAAKWVWVQVRVKHVGRRGDCLVDFLDGSGSTLFPVEELKDGKES